MDLLKNLSEGLNINLSLIEKDIKSIENVNKKNYLNELAKLCAVYIMYHPDWSYLATRVKLLDLEKIVNTSFSDTTEILKDLIHDDYYTFVMKNKEKLNSIIDTKRNLSFGWFGLNTGLRSYFMKIKVGHYMDEGKLKEKFENVEDPQKMFLRVATWIGMHYYQVFNIENNSNIDNVIEKIKYIYDDLSMHNYMHATPTLFNSGLKKPQLSSCFLLHIDDDLHAITKNWHDIAMISKTSGGIGINISNIRHSSIAGGASSRGIVPMCKVKNEIMNYVDQGGKRKGSAAMYLADWHIDIFEFLDLKDPMGKDEVRARELFYALWVSDLFMERVKNDEMWSLFCPNIAKGLNDVWGDDFKKLYVEYENNQLYFKQVKARDIWKRVYRSHYETGLPYIKFKDTVNRKNNQKNLGTIKSSNLCVSGDTMILTDKGQIEIQTLQDQEVKVWNGQEFSDIIVRKTGENKNLLKIKFSNGVELQCTPEHKFYLNDCQKSAKELLSGDKLQEFRLPNNELKYISISSIEQGYQNVDTYCFNEHKRHMGIFNGILTGQCNEIDQYTSDKDISSCNLGSIVLSSCVRSNKKFDFAKLERLTRCLVRNINIVIDINYYIETVPEIKSTNLRDRPMGIGVQGTADMFAMMDLVWDSPEAYQLNKKVSETIYYAAITESIKIAKERKKEKDSIIMRIKNEYKNLIEMQNSLNKFDFESIKKIIKDLEEAENIETHYRSFEGSPASKGILQFDMWNMEKISKEKNIPYNELEKNFDFNIENEKEKFLRGFEYFPEFDWKKVRRDMVTFGLRNSLLIALMPTASTAHLIGNNECFEPFTSLLYTREVLGGRFVVMNHHLIRDLQEIGLWNDSTSNLLLEYQGSIQQIDVKDLIENPDDRIRLRFEFLKKKYLTSYEMSQKVTAKMANDRGHYVCQSQSFNFFKAKPTYQQMSSFFFYQWENGAKTGVYYVRTAPPTKPRNVNKNSKNENNINKKTVKYTCTEEVCMMCQ